MTENVPEKATPGLLDLGHVEAAGPEPEGDPFSALSEEEQDFALGPEIAAKVRAGEISSLNPGVLRLIDAAAEEPDV